MSTSNGCRSAHRCVALGVWAVAILLAGCGSVTPDRLWQSVRCDDQTSCEPTELQAAVQESCVSINRFGWKTTTGCDSTKSASDGLISRQFHKAYLEFSATGYPHQPAQLQAIEHHLRQSTHRPMLIFVYVHGWNHNADSNPDTGSENLDKFDDLLARVKDSLVRTKPISGDPDVLGIYVGWQGKAYDNPVLHILSIGDRAQVADTIAHNKSPRGLHASLSSVARLMRATHPGSRMVVVGHSLGGRMLSKAFVPDILQDNMPPLGERVLINTVNAAIGADFFDAVYAHQPSAAAKMPYWIHLTSRDDTTTREIYPLALQWGLLSPERARRSAASHATIGHFRPYITHKLEVTHVEDTTREICAAQSQQAIAWHTGDFRQFDRCFEEICASPSNAQRYAGLLVRRPMPPASKQALRAAARNGMAEIDFDEIGTDAHSGFPPEQYRVPAQGQMWNIETSGALIGMRDPDPWSFSTHNGYVSTMWMRLLVELAYTPRE